MGPCLNHFVTGRKPATARPAAIDGSGQSDASLTTAKRYAAVARTDGFAAEGFYAGIIETNLPDATGAYAGPFGIRSGGSLTSTTGSAA